MNRELRVGLAAASVLALLPNSADARQVAASSDTTDRDRAEQALLGLVDDVVQMDRPDQEGFERGEPSKIYLRPFSTSPGLCEIRAVIVEPISRTGPSRTGVEVERRFAPLKPLRFAVEADNEANVMASRDAQRAEDEACLALGEPGDFFLAEDQTAARLAVMTVQALAAGEAERTKVECSPSRKLGCTHLAELRATTWRQIGDAELVPCRRSPSHQQEPGVTDCLTLTLRAPDVPSDSNRVKFWVLHLDLSREQVRTAPPDHTEFVVSGEFRIVRLFPELIQGLR